MTFKLFILTNSDSTNLILNFSIILWIIIALFCISFLVQLFYYIRFFSLLIRYKPTEFNSNKNAVSVIICARNEAENLINFLPGILEQDYPDFEVIVVNDRSEDNTEEILSSFKKKYHNLYSTRLTELHTRQRGKKLSLVLGIKAAKNECLLFTDADCSVDSKNWISEMQKNFLINKEIVLGYGPFINKKGLLNKIVRTETFMVAFQYLNYALAGTPYMGVGRNMAYRKPLFFSGNGFARHYHLASGDDDLFVNENATCDNTRIEISFDSFTRSIPPGNLKEWLSMKKRHYTTAKYYSLRSKVLLSVELFTRVIFYLSFFILLFSDFNYLWLLPVFLVRLITQLILFKLSMKRLNENNLLLYSLAYDFLHPLVGSLLYLQNNLSKKNKWK